CHLLSLTPRRLLSSPLFPYTTLFRSREVAAELVKDERPRGRGLRGATAGGRARLLRAGVARQQLDDLLADARQVGAQLHEHLRRSEEHTSELQSRGHLVCRLLLEKKN